MYIRRMYQICLYTKSGKECQYASRKTTRPQVTSVPKHRFGSTEYDATKLATADRYTDHVEHTHTHDTRKKHEHAKRTI